MPYRRRGMGDSPDAFMCSNPDTFDPTICWPNVLPGSLPTPTSTPLPPPALLGPPTPAIGPQPQVMPCNYIGPLAQNQTYPPNCSAATPTPSSAPTAFNLQSFIQQYGIYLLIAAGGLFLFATMSKGGRR